mgnify:CR=1 FL=1
MKTNPNDPVAVFGMNEGLTKREYFAAMALQGIKASTPGCAAEDCSYFAVQEADRLIKELNREKKDGKDNI